MVAFQTLFTALGKILFKRSVQEFHNATCLLKCNVTLQTLPNIAQRSSRDVIVNGYLYLKFFLYITNTKTIVLPTLRHSHTFLFIIPQLDKFYEKINNLKATSWLITMLWHACA